MAVEPDPDNFKALQANTAGLSDVVLIQGGLWGWKARIGQIGNHGEWGKVFGEVSVANEQEEEGILEAYSIKEIAAIHNIPHFDVIKIDIEGAEGMVFSPKADVSWIKTASVVSLEIHDYFGGYYGLNNTGEISNRIASAFRNYQLFANATDNEHTFFINYKTLKTLI